jgi:hypothetical protein
MNSSGYGSGRTKIVRSETSNVRIDPSERLSSFRISFGMVTWPLGPSLRFIRPHARKSYLIYHRFGANLLQARAATPSFEETSTNF